jgi:hypothetical protein
MIDTTRRFGLFQCVLLAITLAGCVSAVDDGVLAPSEETTSDEQALEGVAALSGSLVLGADTAGCDAAAASPGEPLGSYEEFNEILETASVNRDSPELGNTCTRVCKCCKNNGNRFCCSHCRFCSGPIGVIDVLAP